MPQVTAKHSFADIRYGGNVRRGQVISVSPEAEKELRGAGLLVNKTPAPAAAAPVVVVVETIAPQLDRAEVEKDERIKMAQQPGNKMLPSAPGVKR